MTTFTPLGQMYKQANDTVLKRYGDNPEDKWKVDAVSKSRAGEKGHEEVMFQFMKDIELEVDKLLASQLKTSKSYHSNKIAVSETVAPATSPH